MILGIDSTAYSQESSLGSPTDQTPIIEHEGEVGLFLNQEKTDRIGVGIERAIKSVDEYEVLRKDYNECQLDLLQLTYDKSLMRTELEDVKADNDSITSINVNIAETAEDTKDKVIENENSKWIERFWGNFKEGIVLTAVAVLSFQAGQIVQ